ncbi:uncharacterized protein BO80DRAFT_163654 [Aspergillus ibericus CBS 121593]|uniref:Uncharacterized protein n=1 Tax=Aspergillus ibericus CBS 121593 TaxID=1448316 RepID=A0A395GRN6_9EURO|nr:hypothetical protein BO80DRAFT_163654 [Aspergillus ibericus CBS 121593]RAK98205.1 hypothetical protein BO80DRAFT_163654 [Aspergillus ibericus CBS 121593]
MTAMPSGTDSSFSALPMASSWVFPARFPLTFQSIFGHIPTALSCRSIRWRCIPVTGAVLSSWLMLVSSFRLVEEWHVFSRHPLRDDGLPAIPGFLLKMSGAFPYSGTRLLAYSPTPTDSLTPLKTISQIDPDNPRPAVSSQPVLPIASPMWPGCPFLRPLHHWK